MPFVKVLMASIFFLIKTIFNGARSSRRLDRYDLDHGYRTDDRYLSTESEAKSTSRGLSTDGFHKKNK